MQGKNVDKNRFDAIKTTWGRRCTAFIVIVFEIGANSTDIFHIPVANGKQPTNLENVYRFIASTVCQ